MKYIYCPTGVCSRKIVIDAEGDIIRDVQFVGGCNGNLQGISSLVKGESIQAVIDKLAGISCSGKGTSCPDQLSRALREMLGESEQPAQKI
ncbi:TIGR03905 family TSCPD domain-containing protein [Oscillospiraceae bacterium MB08-C2-2]|nr:TIGR03905 family TSCPD domain-containing protein [Oscillospiraceae bacterium MB08-C2-2]